MTLFPAFGISLLKRKFITAKKEIINDIKIHVTELNVEVATISKRMINNLDCFEKSFTDKIIKSSNCFNDSIKCINDDISVIKSNITCIKHDVSDIKTSLDVFKADMHDMSLLIYEIRSLVHDVTPSNLSLKTDVHGFKTDINDNLT